MADDEAVLVLLWILKPFLFMKQIEGHPLYSADESGRIYGHYRNKFLVPQKHNKGYYYIELRVNKKRVLKLIHRLIAQTFIPNPENKPQVNHINGDKTDNRVENLEWCTNSENQIHAHLNGLKKFPLNKKKCLF